MSRRRLDNRRKNWQNKHEKFFFSKPKSSAKIEFDQ